jgi:hypothetical protein
MAELTVFLTSLGFTKSKDDSNLYFKVMNDESVIFFCMWMTYS